MASSLDEALARIMGRPGTAVDAGQTSPPLAAAPPPADTTVTVGGTAPTPPPAPVFSPPTPAAVTPQPVAAPTGPAYTTQWRGDQPSQIWATPTGTEQWAPVTRQTMTDPGVLQAVQAGASTVNPAQSAYQNMLASGPALTRAIYAQQIGMTPQAFRSLAAPERQQVKREYVAARQASPT